MHIFLMKVIPPNRSTVTGRYELVLTSDPGFPYSAHLDRDQLQSLFKRLRLTEHYRSAVMEVLGCGVEYHTPPIEVPSKELIEFGLEWKHDHPVSRPSSA